MEKLIKIFYVFFFSLTSHSLLNSMEAQSAELSPEEIISRIISADENLLSGIQQILVNDKIRFWRKYENINLPINIVLQSFLDNEETASAAINYIKNRAKSLIGLLEWRILPTTTPANLNEILKTNGFYLAGISSVMIYYLDNDKSFDEINSIKRLVDIKTIPNWTKILGRAYNCDWCNEAPYLKYVEKGVTNETSAIGTSEYYAGYFEDILVATGGLFIGNDFGEIYVMATEEQFRKNGLATQMTLTLLKRAKELGLKYVILRCDDSITYLYTKVGFKKAFDIESYCLEA